MENALRYELEANIPELVNELYPTNAPESAKKPYLVYTRINTEKVKTLEGFNGEERLTFMFNIMATRYGDMKSLTKKVEGLLISLIKKNIGLHKDIYIQDIGINNVHEVYEHNLKINRGIIDFTIYY